MVDHATLAKNYAYGDTDGKASNMFIDGQTIYSYGYHFPIATKTDFEYNGLQVVFFNSDGYSNSTARHQSRVKYALDGYFIIEAPTKFIKDFLNKKLEFVDRNTVTSFYRSQIDEYTQKQARARKEWNINFYKERAQYYIDQLNVFKRVILPLEPRHI